jgi:type IV pilus assembly protein PilX
MRAHTPDIRPAHAQHGAVLIISLVLLAIMTLLGVTAMNMNTMEERMAANSQEVNRAFQAAETGLNAALSDNNAFTTAAPVTDEEVTIGDYAATATYSSVFLQKTSPKRGSGWDAARFAFYYFNLSAEGATSNGVHTSVNAGAYQVAQK